MSNVFGELVYQVVELPIVVGASRQHHLKDCEVISRTDLTQVKSYKRKKVPRIKLYLSDLPYSEYGKDMALSMGLVVGYNRKTKSTMTLYHQV